MCETFWAPDPPTVEWCHTGIAVTGSGAIAFGAPGPGELVVIDGATPHGRRVPIELTELHGITAIGERLWVADPGFKARPERDYAESQVPGRVALITLEGVITRELADPFGATRSRGPWRPTCVAPIADGDFVWVADGYGQSVLHLFDGQGQLVSTVDGRETGTAFANPHGLVLWNRADGAALVVADRRNRRLVVLSTDGSVITLIEHPLLRSPSMFAPDGDLLLLTELDGAVLRVHPNGRIDALIDRVPRDEGDDGWPARDGWPNSRVEGRLERPTLIDGVLNSPHGIAVGSAGEILITEWLIGGRYVRMDRPELTSQPATAASRPIEWRTS